MLQCLGMSLLKQKLSAMMNCLEWILTRRRILNGIRKKVAMFARPNKLWKKVTTVKKRWELKWKKRFEEKVMGLQSRILLIQVNIREMLVRCLAGRKVISLRHLLGISRTCIKRMLFHYAGSVSIVKLKLKEMDFKKQQFSLCARRWTQWPS